MPSYTPRSACLDYSSESSPGSSTGRRECLKTRVSPYGMAQIYAALNDKEQTFQWLQIAYDDRAVWMSYLGVDPVFDGFRSDQRFQDLLRRVRLVP